MRPDPSPICATPMGTSSPVAIGSVLSTGPAARAEAANRNANARVDFTVRVISFNLQVRNGCDLFGWRFQSLDASAQINRRVRIRMNHYPDAFEQDSQQ